MRPQGQGQTPPNLGLLLLSRCVDGRRGRRESDYEIEVKTWMVFDFELAVRALEAAAAEDLYPNRLAVALEIWVVLPPPGLDPHEGRKARFS